MKHKLNTRGGKALTLGEKQIIRLMLKGFSRKEIARERHTKLSTVHSQMHLLLSKLGIRKNIELVALALRGKI